jgi:hypothetical protein
MTLLHRTGLLVSLLAWQPAIAVPDTPQAAQDDLAWIAGDWCGGEEGEDLRESWTTPVDGDAIGMSRSVEAGRVRSFEFMRIARVDGVLTYLAQPGGAVPTPFPRSAGGQGWIRFENREHDFPQLFEYRREGAGLTAEIAGPGADGRVERIAYRYRRCTT